MKYAFNTFAFSYLTGWMPAYPLDETVRSIYEAGYDGLELGCVAPHAFVDFVSEEWLKQIRAMLDRYSLSCSSVCVPPGGQLGLNAASQDAEERNCYRRLNGRAARMAAALGCSTMLLVPGWYGAENTRENAWETSRRLLTEIARDARELGIRVVLEPTPEDSNLVNCADDVLQMINEIGLDNVGGMLDTEHILFRQESIPDEIRKLGGRLWHIHVTDANRIPPGAGQTDFRPMLEALEEIGFDGYVTMETGFGKTFTPKESAVIARRYFRELEGGMHQEG